jgi:hypothetical protein
MVMQTLIQGQAAELTGRRGESDALERVAAAARGRSDEQPA